MMHASARPAAHIKESAGDRVFQAVILFFSVLLMIVVAYPLYFTVIASFSKPEDVLLGRVMFWPKNISFESYQMVIAESRIWMGYGNTILYTVLGTLVNLALTTMMAYPLSCKETPFRGPLTFVASFTMLFSGGLIPTYLLVRQLGMYNTIWAMLLPTAITTYNMLVMKNFFQSSIPHELKEAAYLDGCTELQTLFRVVLPLSGSIIAVMVLFYGVGHWNSWFNAAIYLDDRAKYPLQLILREILISNDVSAMGNELGANDQEMISENIKYATIAVATLPIMCVYPFIQKYFVTGVMIGSVKG